jgi:peptidyl-prolyl isomerase G (cyclophilin G)
MQKNTRVFLDIIIGNKAAGRLTIELFEDLTPFTCENFRGLCTGDYGSGSSGYKLCYQDCLFFKLVPQKYLVGGDIVSNTGKDGDSIYGRHFIDENFSRRHSGIGLLSMHSKGANTNSSSFVITLGECPELDDRNVVFGQVIEGIQVLKKIEKTQTDANHKPILPIRIFNCGQLDDGREHIKFEEFREHINIYRAFEERKAQKKEEHLRKYYEMMREKEENEKSEEKEEKGMGGEIEEDEIEEEKVEEGANAFQKELARIRGELKKAKKMNDKAVAEELEKNADPSYEKKRKKKEWIDKEKQFADDLEMLGISSDKTYLTDNIAHAGNVERKKRKREKKASFGWDVFNTDALMRGYKRRLGKIVIDKDQADAQNKDKSVVVLEPTEERVNKMAKELEDEAEKRKKFSRRRPFYEDLDVNYINERNRVYNAKLTRSYKEYTDEIKKNLERGTA